MAAASQNTRRRLDPREYTVGWITALPIEYAAATVMLDEQHESPDRQDNDDTLYTLGQIHGHNLAIACLPAGIIGIASAANIATLLSTRFPNAKIGLMVGIGGAVPSEQIDIRLGDVVVSQPGHGHGGVLQYDLGERLPNGKFRKTSHLDKPPRPLLNALIEVQRNHLLDEGAFLTYLTALEVKTKFSRQIAGPDQLFQPDCQHTTRSSDCARCDVRNLVKRPERSQEEQVQIHYGTIASANSLIKDGVERDRLSRDLDSNILCFEMEAAGLMNNFPCLVIRGICDYADSHKNKKWQAYAAATAAAYAKEVLSVLAAKEVAELAPIKAPWVLPFNRNPLFTGRTDMLETLALYLQNPERHPYAVIYGLGGSGKSAIAIEFAFRTRDRNPLCAVLWVSSFTVETFQDSYREIAKHLQIPDADDLEKDMLSPVRTKLSGEDQGRWLMIVDNVDDKDVLFQTSSNNRRLYDELPHSRQGMILFTTRDRKIAINLTENLIHPLGEMEKTEAENLVKTALSQNKSNLYSETAVAAFLSMLTYLPLAIIQALSFMQSNSTPLDRYVDLFRETRQSMTDLLQEDFEDPTRSKQSRNAVALTWQISFQRIETEDKVAAGYLDFLACIAPQRIPRNILPQAVSSIKQEKAIGTLTAYSFLIERVEKGFYDMHTLVHHITQSRMRDMNALIKATQVAVKRLRELIPPGGHEQAKEYTPYLLHGQYTTDLREILHEKGTIELLDNIGRCYYSLGEYSHAVLSHQEVVKRRERTVGSKDTKTLIGKNQLSLALLSQGRWDEAEKLCIEVMETSKQVLGVDNPSTLTSMANLASTYRNQGRWDAAEKLGVEVTETSKQVLGADHPDTLTSMANLASTYWNQGRWDEAEKLEVEVMETSKQKLGADHPDTLTSMANLASTYWNQGRWAEAEKLDIEVVETRKQRLGADHPDTLTSMANLASTYRNQGRWDEAEKLEVEVMETSKQKLGADHPDTLTSMANLASTYRSQGRWDTAEMLDIRVMEARKQVLGADHPSTLTGISNLASTYRNQGRWGEAEKLGVEVMETSKKLLGADHPSTLTSMANLASTYWKQGRWDAAEKLGVEVMVIRKQRLGADHPSTLISISNLASTYRSQGRWAEAEKLDMEVVENRKQRLGASHPSTLTSISNLASTYKNQGRWDEAERLDMEVMETSKQKLGADHPDTLTSMANLASTYRNQGRWDDAKKLEVEVDKFLSGLDSRTSLVEFEPGTYLGKLRQHHKLSGHFIENSGIPVISKTFVTNVGLGLASQLHNFTFRRHRTPEHELYQDEASNSSVDD